MLRYAVDDDFSDCDWTWVGQDKNGILATFTTAGAGPVPQSLLSGHDKEQLLSIEDEILRLNEIAKAHLNPAVDYPNVESYLKLSKRGFYSFDWSDLHKKAEEKRSVYELIFKPTVYLDISSLPEITRRSLLVTKLPDVDFVVGDVKNIRV